MRREYSEYTVDYISGCMSLRKPQKRSLKILDDILDEVTPAKNMDLGKALRTVHDMYPTCSNFERDFMSLTFQVFQNKYLGFQLCLSPGGCRLIDKLLLHLFEFCGIQSLFHFPCVIRHIAISPGLRGLLLVPQLFQTFFQTLLTAS